MKNLKLIALLFLLAGVVQAQTSDNPWLISAGINGIGLQSDFTGGDNALVKDDYNTIELDPLMLMQATSTTHCEVLI